MYFDLGFFTSLLLIVFIDLALSGDNAVVIAMAANRLPSQLRLKAICFGVAGAIIFRILATIFVLYLLALPWLRLVGGLLLLWISYKLLIPEDDETDGPNVKASSHLLKAICIIVAADAMMALDNMLGVASVADGSKLLVILGLIISIPITVGGSAVIMKGLEKFPWLIYVGSGILVYTAVHMMLQEAYIKNSISHDLKYLIYPVIIGLVLLVGKSKRTTAQSRAN